MNSVKFGQRSGRFRAVEDNLIELLIAYGVCYVYPNLNRFKIEYLIEDLEDEIKRPLKYEPIKSVTTNFNPTLGLVEKEETIGFKIFLK